MKKLSFICIVCLCAALQTNAQLRDTIVAKNSFSKDHYLQKSKQQKTIGWILLGGGVVLGTITAAHPDEWTLSSLLGPFVGLGIVIYSVHFFNKAAKNKRKANLMLKDETVFFNPQLNIKELLVVATLKINF